jgi:hypothetical protein
MPTKIPAAEFDKAASKNGQLDGSTIRIPDDAGPPPFESGQVAAAHQQGALEAAEHEREVALLEGRRDGERCEVELLHHRTEQARTRWEVALKHRDETPAAGSQLLAITLYGVTQASALLVDALTNQQAFFVLPIKPFESLGMSVCLGIVAGGVADWYGGGGLKKYPRLGWAAGAAFGGLSASLACVRAAFFQTPGVVVPGRHVSPIVLAAAMSGIGVAVFCFTAVIARTYHERAAERARWAQVRGEERHAKREHHRCEHKELQARKKLVLTEALIGHEEARHHAQVRAWFARFARVISVYRTAFARAAGEMPAWMRQPPRFGLDIAAPVSLKPIRDADHYLADEPSAVFPPPPSADRTGNDGGVQEDAAKGDEEQVTVDVAPAQPEELICSVPRRRNGTSAAAGAAVVLLLLLFIAGLSGCAGRSRVGIDRVVLFDLSDTDWPGDLRDEYTDGARALIDAMEDGDCASFDIIRERADDQRFPVAGCLTVVNDNPLALAAARQQLADSLTAGVTTLLEAASRTPNSPLVEAIVAAPHRFALHPALTHELTVFTDAVQQSAIADLAAEPPTSASITAMINKLGEVGEIAHLQGVRLRIATVGGGEYDRLPPVQHQAIREFWLAYAAAAGARMDSTADYGSITRR